jgi:hypothetical protein
MFIVNYNLTNMYSIFSSLYMVIMYCLVTKTSNKTPKKPESILDNEDWGYFIDTDTDNNIYIIKYNIY